MNGGSIQFRMTPKSYFLDALSVFSYSPSKFRNKYDFFRNGWQLWYSVGVLQFASYMYVLFQEFIFFVYENLVELLLWNHKKMLLFQAFLCEI